jgi:tetratricopeptide (TPR) repeat protein/DNA-binding CsgD family transcriptional regulator
MKNVFLSRFTPSLMSSEALEAIFVQRHQLADDLLNAIVESASTKNKHFRLLIGARGIGKTYLIALIYHRVINSSELQDKLIVAWMREEEWGISSFLDLLLRIFRAIAQEYPKEYQAKLEKEVEELYQFPDQAEDRAAELLRKFVSQRTLLLLIENLDDIFNGLGVIGQQNFKAYIDKYPFLTILATAPSLFNSIKQRKSPFYGLFYVHHLEELKLDEAIELLAYIAKFEEKSELKTFLQSSTGRDRIEAIHHLAGGNHRVYVILAEFLTRKSLDELVEAFMQTLDELTPYYQAKIFSLSQQQRKIVEFLCDRRHPVTVKEIARRCFITHQTASSQLKDLREKGYVNVDAIGRESYYELREILMRFCLEVKKQRGEPIQLIVDFLRTWYTQQELQQLLERFSDKAIEREYVLKALQKIQQEQDPRLTAYIKSLFAYFEKGNLKKALQILEKLVVIRRKAEDWCLKGQLLGMFEKHEEALKAIDKAIKINSNIEVFWFAHGLELIYLKRYNEAFVSFKKAISLNSNDIYKYLKLINFLGIEFGQLERYEEAVNCFTFVTTIDPDNLEAWRYKSMALIPLENWDEALTSFEKVIQLNPNDAEAWRWHGIALNGLKQFEQALVSIKQALELNIKDDLAWFNQGVTLGFLRQYKKAIESFNETLKIEPDFEAAWYCRGLAFFNLQNYEQALVSYEKAIALNPNESEYWSNIAAILGHLERYEEALASCNKAIELKIKSSFTFLNRGEFLLALNRWDEGISALDNVFENFANKENSLTENATAIIRNLLKNNCDTAFWKTRINTLIRLYDKHQLLSLLGQGLVKSIPALMPEMVSDRAVQTWLEVWQELAGNRLEFQIPLRLLKAAVRYRITKGDRRALLELPIEERNLLQPLLTSQKISN